MPEDQQEETRDYFGRHAIEWRAKAEGHLPARVNVIRQRNDLVLRFAEKLPAGVNTLDVGCGSGELVVTLAKRGFHAVGVDFAENMILLGQERATRENADNAVFVTSSIFDYRPPCSFSLISACGFIEYISLAELHSFLRVMRGALSTGGTLVVGSRNRLFNLYSTNEFTDLEASLGTVPALLCEARTVVASQNVETLLTELRRVTEPLPTAERHPKTGVSVTTRHQYTPGELARYFGEAGFRPVGLFPVHYHAAVPRFKVQHPGHHVLLSDLMQEHADDCHYLVPQASSFMLAGVGE